MQAAEVEHVCEGLEAQPDVDREGGSSPEIVELSAVDYFSLARHSAQKQASVAKEPKKRVHASHGPSDRTIRRWKQAKRHMEAQGFLSLPDFFKHRDERAKQHERSKAELMVVEAVPEDSEDMPEAPEGSTEAAATSEEPPSASAEMEKSFPKHPAPRASTAMAEEEEEEEDTPFTPVAAVSASATAQEEEEEEEEDVEVTLSKASGTTFPTCPPSSSDPDEFECASWGPSRTILYESEETSSSSDTPSDPDDLQGSGNWELEGDHHRNVPDDAAPQRPMGSASELLRDHIELQAAQRELALMARQKPVDLVLHGHVAAMVGFLNLCLDKSLGYTWKKASEVAARTEGRGTSRARSTRQWVSTFACTRELPTHKLRKTRLTVLDNDDIAHELKIALGERVKNGFLTAADVVDVVSGPEMQAQFVQAGFDRPTISLSTARRWLSKLGWRYGRHRGMYADGHEREDVVEYRQAFVHRFEQYERRFHTWDDTGNEGPQPPHFPVPGAEGRFHLILVTHDESIFYQNDQRDIHWGCPGGGAPKPKGEGVSLMVSDFLTPEWGRLRSVDKCVVMVSLPFNQSCSPLHSEARVIFRPGKNRDGWFTANHLLVQVENAIKIFDQLTKGNAQALFLFDNAPSHQKRADDAISARRMVKGAYLSCVRYLVLIHPSTKEGLDTSHWRTTHALWFTPQWAASIVLFSRRPPRPPWLVQRHGGNPS